MARVELATYGLQNRCSAIELHRREEFSSAGFGPGNRSNEPPAAIIVRTNALKLLALVHPHVVHLKIAGKAGIGWVAARAAHGQVQDHIYRLMKRIEVAEARIERVG